MSRDALGLVSSLMVYAGQEIAAAQYAASGELEPLVRAGWIVPRGWPAIVSCEVCNVPHPAELVERGREPRALCMRTGETFEVSEMAALYRIDAGAVAESLSLALKLSGGARHIKGTSNLWRLGDRRLLETRVVFFFTPRLGELDGASTIFDTVAAQSGAARSALIVASDNIDHVRLLNRKVEVLRLRDVAFLAVDGKLEIDEANLAATVLPDLASARSPGAPASQREKILPILDAMLATGLTIDMSNKICRAVQERFRKTYPQDNVPVHTTIRAAIEAWKR